jgi:hypothetical protein
MEHAYGASHIHVASVRAPSRLARSAACQPGTGVPQRAPTEVSRLGRPVLDPAVRLTAGPRVAPILVASAFLAAALVELWWPRLDAIANSGAR